MSSDTPDEFAAGFGKIARTLEYDDSEGRLVFAFDGSPKGQKHLVLEHGALTSDYKSGIPRGLRYDRAFERTKKYLESCGYEVVIYGK